MSKINNNVFDITNLIKSHDQGNTKGRSRCWFFNWNNFGKENLKMIISESQKYNYLYVMQEEIGENGTPYLQFVLKFENQKTFKVLKEKYSKCHIEKAKSWNACKNYCKKYSTRVGKVYTNVPGLKWKKKLIVKYFKWQEELINVMEKQLEGEDKRTINWIYDEFGGKGKTTFARHWYRENSKTTCLINGRVNDIKSFLASMFHKHNIQYDYIFLNFPRNIREHINYQGLEDIKDGFFFNSKHRGSMIDYDRNPVVIVMANFLPNENKILKKFNIIKIK